MQPGAVMDLTLGRVITWKIEPEETMTTFKQRVLTLGRRVPEPDEEVRMLCNGKELDDLYPLADYELPRDGVADLVSGITLLNPSETVQDVKRKIQNPEDPVEFQRLNYKQQPLTDDTKTLSVYKIFTNSTLDLTDANPIYITTDVDPRNNPIFQLKEVLQDLECIPAAQQKIFFAEKLLDYCVLKGATSDMNPSVTQVTVVTPDGKKIALSVDPTEPVSAIKDKLQFWEGVLSKKQWLVYRVLLEDETLSDYDVPFDGVLDFEEPFMVYVHFSENAPGVSKVKDLSESESCGIVPASAGVVANVPRRDGSVGLINKAKDRGFTEYNTVNERTPTNADIEHFLYNISIFAVLLGVSFLIIGYVMGANAIHLTVASAPEGLLLIGLMLTAKRKRMLATNHEDLEIIGCTSSTSTYIMFCSVCCSVCMQTVIDIYLFVLNSKHGRSNVMV